MNSHQRWCIFDIAHYKRHQTLGFPLGIAGRMRGDANALESEDTKSAPACRKLGFRYFFHAFECHKVILRLCLIGGRREQALILEIVKTGSGDERRRLHRTG